MRIVVGITGGIAAYKAPELVRLLKKAGHEVRCAATEHALEFVTRVTLETVSGAPLYSDLFASGRTEHISLKDWGEMLVVAPATANIIGKVASGIADDALSTLLLAFSGKPVIMAPAMMPEKPLEIRAIPLPPHKRPTSTEMIALIIQVIWSRANMSFVSIFISISESDR